MQRVISASRRTDIPAFYSRWFMNRVRAGFCHVINPYGGRVTRVALDAASVRGVVFWTRNPGPLLPHLAELRGRGLPFAFQVTINGYPRTIEEANPPIATAIAAFLRAAAAAGPALTHWRYDPIVLSDRTPPAYHLTRFERISAALAGATARCSLSFVDRYGKTERNLAHVARRHDIHFDEPSADERRSLVRALRDIATDRGITLYACCEPELAGDGIEPGRCIDAETVRRFGEADELPRPAPTRPHCGCVAAVDVGAYDTCLFGCAYCYATTSARAARGRHGAHDPEDTVLWRPASLCGVDLETRLSRPRGGTATANDALVPLIGDRVG